MRLIDADALKEDINNAFLRCLDMQYVKDIIDNAPTVERPQGEWIADEFGRKICGKCQFPFAEFQSGNYCSLCGADMRGGRE